MKAIPAAVPQNVIDSLQIAFGSEANGRWTCVVCGEHDGIHGGIRRQMSNTKAIAGHCRWCDQNNVLVKRTPAT